VKIQETNEGGSAASSDHFNKSVEVERFSINQATHQENIEAEEPCDGSTNRSLSDEDEDFLDMLVDTLDEGFDPSLLL